MAAGKWIEGLGPSVAVGEAARRVLEPRLDVVRHYFPLAVHEPDRDPEHVHQLRVGTRRAGAALRIFAATLPGKSCKKARKVLRKLRRAAGAARDWDVFIADLLSRRKRAKPREEAGLDFLVGHAANQRDAAQTHLLEADARHGERLKTLFAETVESIREPGADGKPGTLRELGRSLLHDLLKELDWAGARDMDDYDHLHRVRILGKQLRYAMEVFADCFPPAFKEDIYPRVEEMQEALGRANDSHGAGWRLEGLRERMKRKWPADWPRYRPGIEGLLRFHRRRLPRERDRFIKWWQKWSDRHTEELRALLQGPGSLPAAAPLA